MAGNSDLGEQALSKAVEVGLAAGLDEVEVLEVEIHTNPVALMQGELESADIQGQGLVIKGDLRTEELTVQTDGVAIDPMKAALGEVELTRPTKAKTVVTLTEADIERAFNSQYILRKLQNLEVTLDDRPAHVNAQQVRFSLPGGKKVAIAADITVQETGETQHLSFSAVPSIGPQGHRVVLENVQMESENASQALTNSLLAVASELLDLRNFALSSASLQMQRIDIQPGQMVLEARAHLSQFPGS